MKRFPLVSTIISPVIVLLLTAGSAAAADKALWDAALEPDPALAAPESVARSEDERQVEPLEQKGGFLGYNYVGTDGYGGRAEQYSLLQSSTSGGLFYKSFDKDTRVDLEGDFLNEHDYRGDFLIDYQGDYRVHLRTESLYHNLERDLLFPSYPNSSGTFQAGRTDAGTPATYSAQQDNPFNYGISVVQDSADFRYRLHNFPLHVNVGYWRLEREGVMQQRFADASFEGTPNTIYAQARSVNQKTQEGHLGVDAHLGWLDVIYNFRVRVFEDGNATPVANYVSRDDIHGTPERAGGLLQHNENPETTSMQHMLKLHTSLSGGLVASGSYSIEQRENLSSLSDTQGASHMTVNLQNAAGDLVYTPSKEYTVAVKYRHQDLDNGDRGPVTSIDFVNQPQQVKAPMNTSRDLVSAQLSYRPRNDLSMNGEYRGQYLTRNNVSALPSPGSWALPENTSTQTGTLSVYYRPIKGLRSSAQYSYSTTDHPSYGTSYQQKHEGKLLATYSRNNNWGATANVNVRREGNDQVDRFLINYPLDPLVYTPYPLLSRDRSSENANLAVWCVPIPKLSVGANYAYLHSQVDQAVLFTTVAAGSQAASDYFSRSHVYGVNGSYAPTDKLDLSLMLQQVRSVSAFDPQSASFGTAGIGDLSREGSVTSYLSARGEYRFTASLSGSLTYNLSDYNEKNPIFSSYTGTVHTVFATVGAKW